MTVPGELSSGFCFFLFMDPPETLADFFRPWPKMVTKPYHFYVSGCAYLSSLSSSAESLSSVRSWRGGVGWARLPHGDVKEPNIQKLQSSPSPP